MELTESQYQRIANCLLRQRGNVSMTNLRLLNALLYVTEHGCKWRGLPKHLGNCHTIYTRMNRWSKAGVRPFASSLKINGSDCLCSSETMCRAAWGNLRSVKRPPTVPHSIAFGRSTPPR